MKIKLILVLVTSLLFFVTLLGFTYYTIQQQTDIMINDRINNTIASGTSYSNNIKKIEDMMTGRMTSAALYICEIDKQRELSLEDINDIAKKTGMSIIDLIDGNANWQVSTDPDNQKNKPNLLTLGANYKDMYGSLFNGGANSHLSSLMVRKQDGKVYKFYKLVRSNGKGIVQVGIQAKDFESIQNEMVGGDKSIRNIALLDPTGIVLTSVNSKSESASMFESGKPVSDEWLTGKLGAKEATYRLFTLSDNESGLQVLIPIIKNGTTEQYTVLTVSLQEVYNTVESYKWKMIGIAFAVMLLMFVIMYLFTSRFTSQITRPIGQVVDIINGMAERGGDLTQEVKLKSYYEINSLGIALNKLLKSVRDLVADIQLSANELSISSEQLALNANSSAESVGMVANSIIKVSSGAERQMNISNRAAKAVENLAESIRGIAENTQAADDVSHKAAITLNSGKGAIIEAVDQMNNLQKYVYSSAEQVEKLHVRTKEIGSLVEAITSVAKQTNLLALNAAIESARAGEHGRGFSVVAEEVKKLAEQSSSTAQKIIEVIKQIQQDTINVINMISRSSEEISSSSELVNSAGQAFSSISSQIDNLTGEIKDISISMQQMASNSEEIVMAVKEIDNVSHETSTQAQEVTATTQDQAASMEEIAASSETLAETAEKLKDAVNKFKI